MSCNPLEINMKDYFLPFHSVGKNLYVRVAILVATASLILPSILANSAWAQSGETAGELSNIETLLNITANSIEIIGFASQPQFFLGAIAIFIRKRWRLGWMLLGCAFALAIISLAAPGFFHWFFVSARDADATELGVGLCAIFGFAWSIYICSLLFVPSVLAFISGNPKRKLILGCNFLVLLPFVYPLLLWYVLKDEGKADSKWADSGSNA